MFSVLHYRYIDGLLTTCGKSRKICLNVMQRQRRPTLKALRRARADAGLTISELAKRAGVSRDTISNAERGLHSLQASTLYKVAQALGRTPSELLAEEEKLAPKEVAPLSQRSLFNGVEEERRSLLSPWAEYARRMAGRIQRHTDDPHSTAFRDAHASLFFVEERNRDVAELWGLLVEEELERETFDDEPLAALNAVLAAFEELTEALGEAQRRAEQMAAGFAESEIGQARLRAAEAAAQREQATARVSTRLERRGA